MRVIIESDNDAIALQSPSLDEKHQGWWLAGSTPVTGWNGTPATDAKSERWVGRDGASTPLELTQPARTVTVKGFAVTESDVAAAMAMDRLNDLMGRMLTLSVIDAHGLRTMRGYLSDDPAETLWNWEKHLNFTLIFHCPDPHKYGPEIAFTRDGDAIGVENDGQLPVWPSIHAEGKPTMVKLTYGGHAVQWSGTADSFDLDFADMVPSAGAIGVDDAFQLPPGLSSIGVETTPKDIPVRAILRPAFR